MLNVTFYREVTIYLLCRQQCYLKNVLIFTDKTLYTIFLILQSIEYSVFIIIRLCGILKISMHSFNSVRTLKFYLKNKINLFDIAILLFLTFTRYEQQKKRPVIKYLLEIELEIMLFWELY